MADANQVLAQLAVESETLSLPVIEASDGSLAVDISSIYKTANIITFDSGFMNTAEAASAITYIDGYKGILCYRGYPIEQLANNSHYLEVSYLLIYGNLPTSEQLTDFTNKITEQRYLPPELLNLIDKYPNSAHPMAVLGSVVAALPGFYPDLVNISDTVVIEKTIIKLLAIVPIIAAEIYRKFMGKNIVEPIRGVSYVENFLAMTVCADNSGIVDTNLVSALDLLFLLHADHEQNCSTSTARLIGSADTSIFTAVAGAIGALWGPLHGGANQAVIEMLLNIKEHGGDPELFMQQVKDKSAGQKLMGFGHRVYKNYDPRAKIIKRTAETILTSLNKNDELLDIALKLEAIALADAYFVDRKLYPNVDFYTGLIYKAMGFPSEMFTVLFAIGRLPGWLAHWKEMHDDPNNKIGRPRQVYTGELQRDYVSIEDRN